MLGILLLSACSADNTPFVELNHQRYFVEIADDEGERALGLMFRKQMPENHGMVFIFDQAAPRSFWMKNTHIPLDIFYFDSALRLLNIQENVPPCRSSRCPSYPSKGKAQYVLELNAGQAKKLNLQPGTVLDLSW